MTNPANPSSESTIQQILKTGTVTAADVQALQSNVDSDRVVDQAEVETLFKANRAIASSDEECPEWTQFFVSTVTRLVVMDLFTPGEIDEAEGDWLGGLLDSHSIGNESEQKLLAEIQNTTTSISGGLGKRISPLN